VNNLDLFGADLINTSKFESRKTKWLQTNFLAYVVKTVDPIVVMFLCRTMRLLLLCSVLAQTK